MPRIMPEERYFSIPSVVVGGVVFRNLRLELLAMRAVVEPFARGGDPFTGRDRRGVAHHRHEVANPAGLDAQHAEAILGIVEGHTLDDAGQDFLRCGMGRL